MDKVADRRPDTGCYYLVPTADLDWKLMAFPSRQYGHLGHDEFFTKYIAPYLQDEFGLKEKPKESKHYRGIPRGRVDLSASDGEIQVEGEKPGMIYVWHGNDFPHEEKEYWKGKIISAFHLEGPSAHEKVEFKYAEHETMLKDHIKALWFQLNLHN